MSISGWCQSLGKADAWHDVCEDRLRRGLLDHCDCPSGHGETLTQQGIPGSEAGRMGATERAPDRVLGGPQSRALATNQSKLKGA